MIAPRTERTATAPHRAALHRAAPRRTSHLPSLAAPFGRRALAGRSRLYKGANGRATA